MAPQTLDCVAHQVQIVSAHGRHLRLQLGTDLLTTLRVMAEAAQEFGACGRNLKVATTAARAHSGTSMRLMLKPSTRK